MSAKQLVLWRHGQTDYNVAGRVQGAVDTDLNDEGREQAHRAAAVLAEMAPLRIISSPLARATQSAWILANRLDEDVNTDARLKERSFGKLEGLSVKQVLADYPKEYEQWRSVGECPRAGVELRALVGARVSQCISEAAAATPEGHTLVVVSHGSALTQGLVSLIGLDPSSWAGIRGLDNCHWSLVLPARRHPKWRIAGHNIGA